MNPEVHLRQRAEKNQQHPEPEADDRQPQRSEKTQRVSGSR